MPKTKNQAVTSDPNFVEHGSDRHAAILGLRKATQDDTLVRDGWTLIDMTMHGPQVTDAYLREVLRQKVSELKTPPPMPQSVDRNAPNYLPPLNDPQAEWQPVTDTV